MTKKKQNIKLISCWIETYKNWQDYPTLMLKKPLKREIDNAKEFGYEIYPCIITIDLKNKL